MRSSMHMWARDCVAASMSASRFRERCRARHTQQAANSIKAPYSDKVPRARIDEPGGEVIVINSCAIRTVRMRGRGAPR